MRKFSEPLFACLDLTYRCNLSCKHCLFSNGVNIESSTDKIKRMLDYLDEKKYISVQFSGGEPLLRNDFVELLDYAGTKKFAISVATNGLLIDKKIIDAFIRNKVVNVQLSIDGLECSNDELRGKGTFKKIMIALDELKEQGIVTSVATMVTEDNKNEMKELYDMLIEKKLAYWRLQYIVGEKRLSKTFGLLDYLRVLEDVERYAKEKKEKIEIMIPCYIQKKIPKMLCSDTLLNITPSGEIEKCFINSRGDGTFIKYNNYQLEGEYYICENAIEGNE